MGEEVACLPLARQLTFTPMSEDEDEFALSSPHHTRSGRIYTGSASSRRRRGRVCPVQSPSHPKWQNLHRKCQFKKTTRTSLPCPVPITPEVAEFTQEVPVQ